MRAHARSLIPALLCASALWAAPALAQQPLPQAAPSETPKPELRPDFGQTVGGGRASVFMQVPVSHLFPGAVPTRPPIKNPNEGDPRSPQRGMVYFKNLNCVGCHADNGGGGMGPALSNRTFIYGSAPENIYLTIYQGRPNGMPAWGAAIPDSIIWDLVTYIGHLSNEPSTEWGRTFSLEPLSPQIEQVPVEHIQTFDPWAHTKKFSMGQKP
jgi:cytochrome c oxidase cbb3-type subunit 3